jgi:hypothetical protein
MTKGVNRGAVHMNRSYALLFRLLRFTQPLLVALEWMKKPVTVNEQGWPFVGATWDPMTYWNASN